MKWQFTENCNSQHNIKSRKCVKERGSVMHRSIFTTEQTKALPNMANKSFCGLTSSTFPDQKIQQGTRASKILWKLYYPCCTMPVPRTTLLCWFYSSQLPPAQHHSTRLCWGSMQLSPALPSLSLPFFLISGSLSLSFSTKPQKSWLGETEKGTASGGEGLSLLG